MRILQINNNHFNLGGAEVVYFNTIKLLTQNNFDIITLSQKDEKNILTTSSEYFINKPNNIVKKIFSIEGVKAIDEIIDNEKPEVAHFHNIIGGITFSVLKKLKERKIPIIATIHDFRLMCPAYVFMNSNNEICEKCKGGKYYHCILNKCISKNFSKSVLVTIESYMRDFFLPFENTIDYFIFVSNFSRNKFIDSYSLISNKSSVLYNFSFAKNKFSVLRGKYYLFFGRLSHEKGILTLLKAFKEIPDVQLKIVGDGQLRNFVEGNLSKNIEYLGFQSGVELENLIKNASFIVVPSECYENNPLSIIEAYSFSKPVIGSDLGGIKEVVIDGLTGFLFKHNNLDSLRLTVMKSRDISMNFYHELSQNAYNFFINNFSHENHFKKLCEIYSKILT